MKKMTGRVTCCCVALLLALSSVSAVKKLKSIQGLKKINFDQSVPAHTLLLLHWFANAIIIDQNDEIRPTFDPRYDDYGAHHYGNYEELLDEPPRGHQYYTVGNLNKNKSSSVRLPGYVLNPPPLFHGGNRDRIIFSLSSRDRIGQVFITQHYENSDNQGTTYDPYHTYQITPHLLRQIQEFSLNGDYQTLVDLRNRYGGLADVSINENNWGKLAFLQLFLCIVMNKMVHIPGERRQPERRFGDDSNENRGPGRNNNSECCISKRRLCLVVLVVLVIVVVIALIIGLTYS